MNGYFKDTQYTYQKLFHSSHISVGICLKSDKLLTLGSFRNKLDLKLPLASKRLNHLLAQKISVWLKAIS